MSDREKKLLIFFGIAGFVILNILAFNFAQAKRVQVNQDKTSAQARLESSELFREKRDQIEPAAAQDVQTKLQQFAEKKAGDFGLTIKSQKPMPTDTTGVHFHRVQFQFVVTGAEDALYQWFDQINMPDQLRHAAQIRLSPNTQDDTQIDCTTTIEQFFVPASS